MANIIQKETMLMPHPGKQEQHIQKRNSAKNTRKKGNIEK